MLRVDFLLCATPQVLALPGLVWKQLTGEAVSWNKDFPAVDSVLVRTLKWFHLITLNVKRRLCRLSCAALVGERLIFLFLLTRISKHQTEKLINKVESNVNNSAKMFSMKFTTNTFQRRKYPLDRQGSAFT